MSDWSFTFDVPDGVTTVTILPFGIRLNRKDGPTAQHSFDELLGQKHSIVGWADQNLADKVRSIKTIYPLLNAEVRAGRLAGTFDELASIAAGRVPLRGFGESKRYLLAQVLEEPREVEGMR